MTATNDKTIDAALERDADQGSHLSAGADAQPSVSNAVD